MPDLDASAARRRLVAALRPLVDELLAQLPPERMEELVVRGLGVALDIQAEAPLRATFVVYEPLQHVAAAEIPPGKAGELEEAALTIVAGATEAMGQSCGVGGLAGSLIEQIGSDPSRRFVVHADMRTGDVQAGVMGPGGETVELGGIDAAMVTH